MRYCSTREDDSRKAWRFATSHGSIDSQAICSPTVQGLRLRKRSRWLRQRVLHRAPGILTQEQDHACARRVTTKAIVRPRLCGVHPRHQRRLAGPYVEVAATTNSVAAAGMRAAARRPVRGVGGRADLGRDKPSPISAGQA